MKYYLIFFAGLFLFASAAYAYSGSYCVTGAGTTLVNGTYTQNATANVWDMGTSYVMFNAGAGGGSFTSACGALIGTGFAELRSCDNTKGYYYDNHGAGGTVESFNTVNGDGTAPIPTVTQGACASPNKFQLWVMSLF